MGPSIFKPSTASTNGSTSGPSPPAAVRRVVTVWCLSCVCHAAHDAVLHSPLPARAPNARANGAVNIRENS